MAYKSYKGWYRIINPEKFIAPIDEHMQSFRDGKVNYKSKLELKAIRYCDFNTHITKWSLEPFNIKYVKPTDGQIHRYYIDLYVEFSTGNKFLVEVKSLSETKPPKKPITKTERAMRNYQRAVMTYAVNRAKWDAATQFAAANNMKFIFLTEEQLG